MALIMTASGGLADSILVKAPDLFCHSAIPVPRRPGALHSGLDCACDWSSSMKIA